MSKKSKKIERALSICDRQTATLAEIVECCNLLSKVTVFTSERKGERGILSLSHFTNGIGMCVWVQQPDDDRLIRLSQITVRDSQLQPIKGIIEVAQKDYMRQARQAR